MAPCLSPTHNGLKYSSPVASAPPISRAYATAPGWALISLAAYQWLASQFPISRPDGCVVSYGA